MKTSIAMTTYNGRKYIDELLDSILYQDESPDEVVIVDDCSSDGTFEYVNEYISKNGLNSWRNYRNETNLGWRLNFREAFKKCSGDLIFLCDQDDFWMPYKVSEMKKVMEQNLNIQLLVSNYSVKNVDRSEKVRIFKLDCDDGSVEKINFSCHSLSVMRPGCTYCARKNLIDKIWEHDSSFIPHDAILWGYAAINDSIFRFNRKTIQFKRHSESASNPVQALCLTRRIEEIAFDIEVVSFFLEECKGDKFQDKRKILESQLEFCKKRKKILKEKSVIKLIFFQMKNFMHYSTLRNMFSDEYVLFLER